MTDFADLGMRFSNQGGEEQVRVLDQIAEKAPKAEKATEGVSSASRRMSDAMMQMLAGIQKTLQSIDLATSQMRDLQVGMAEGAMAALKEAEALKQVASSANAAAPAMGKAATESMNLASAAKTTSKALADQNAHVIAYRDHLAKLPAANDNAAKSMRAATQAGIGLSRQFADIGVSAAMGINPLMILIQQGPQIADQMALMKTQGVGMSEAFKAMGASMRGVLAMLAPLAAPLLGLAAAAAAAFGAAALAARNLNKENGDLTKGMGLTEKQLERLKEKGVETGVTIGDVFKGVFNYLKDAIAPALKPVMDWFSRLFDTITKGAVSAVKGLVGGFLGAFEAIKATWKMFPAALGDLFISGVNIAIRAINDLVQKSLTAINGLIDKANVAAKKVGLTIQLPTLAVGTLGEMNNPYAGSAAQAAKAAREAFANGRQRGDQIVDGILGGISNAILDAARTRIRKAAGDADKGRKASAPRDLTDETAARIAQEIAALDRQIAEAKKAQLQVEMKLVGSADARANIQRRIDEADYDGKIAGYRAKIAQIDGQIAQISEQKLNTAKAEQIAALEILKGKYEQLKNEERYTKVMKELADNFEWLDKEAERQAELAKLRSEVQIE